MRTLIKVVIAICLLSTSFMSAALTFTIGVTEFYPPFVMQTANHKLYGFDISLAKRLCKDLKVDCKFKTMRFDELLPSILLGKIDLAMSALVITKERLQMIHFSAPYMYSEARFMAHHKMNINVFTKETLNNKRIGVQLGTLYVDYLLSLNLSNTKITYFNEEGEQVSALMHDKVDLILVDNPAAIWWSMNSTNRLKMIGNPFQIGLGIGIAVADKNKQHIEQINLAIQKWKKDGSFDKHYRIYFNPIYKK